MWMLARNKVITFINIGALAPPNQTPSDPLLPVAHCACVQPRGALRLHGQSAARVPVLAVGGPFVCGCFAFAAAVYLTLTRYSIGAFVCLTLDPSMPQASTDPC